MYPNEQTALAESDETGDSAEACFTQLLNAGVIDDEHVFWSKENIVLGTVNAEIPDNDGVLTTGENAWSYVRGLSTSSPTNTVIICDASKSPRVFDNSVWEGQAVVAKLNGSVEMMKITPAGEPDGGIYDTREGKRVKLFKNLPDGAKILVPGLE
ncbi:MAG: hypothetical protein ABGY95_03875 [Rubritalea sp.]|uniref:hypothetical protein n=1 Tax=Rubritalea sp. TaxID=2109375 RepID=UPI003242C5B1